MVECQWDSVVLSPYSPVLAGLELTFMGLTRSNSSLFSTPGFVVALSEVNRKAKWFAYFKNETKLFLRYTLTKNNEMQQIASIMLVLKTLIAIDIYVYISVTSVKTPCIYIC